MRRQEEWPSNKVYFIKRVALIYWKYNLNELLLGNEQKFPDPQSPRHMKDKNGSHRVKGQCLLARHPTVHGNLCWQRTRQHLRMLIISKRAEQLFCELLFQRFLSAKIETIYQWVIRSWNAKRTVYTIQASRKLNSQFSVVIALQWFYVSDFHQSTRLVKNNEHEQ